MSADINVRKDHSEARIHPPILWLFHVLAAILLSKFLPWPFAFPDVVKWLGFALVILGLGLGLSAVNGIWRARTTLDPHGSVSDIVTSGPFRFTRNPMYLGLTCFLTGIPFIFKSYWGLVLSLLFIVLMNLLVIQYEETYLEQKFGEQYTSYKSHVRRWI
ncbi:MAG TPA: isoprenylcysteine carboxylmethyltransferase family protein [Anaerolineales bacterium]|nr:isoprenylcysteine carboxylmethyltransferase family protein [Anaerolineales bacterium]